MHDGNVSRWDWLWKMCRRPMVVYQCSEVVCTPHMSSVDMSTGSFEKHSSNSTVLQMENLPSMGIQIAL